MSAARVLAALLDAHEADGRATVRSLATAVGLQTNTVHEHLKRLRAAGLVAWAEDTAGTLRPLVARVDAWVDVDSGRLDQYDTRELCTLWDDLANTGAAEGPSSIGGRS